MTLLDFITASTKYTHAPAPLDIIKTNFTLIHRCETEFLDFINMYLKQCELNLGNAL